MAVEVASVTPFGGFDCTGTGSKFCGRCGIEAYCSTDCQRKAWPTQRKAWPTQKPSSLRKKAVSPENPIRELLKEFKLYSAREQLNQLPKPNPKLQAELEELISMGMHSEVVNGAITLQSVGDLGQGYVATRDLKPEEPLLFDTAFLTAPVDKGKAPHFLMAEKLAKRHAGGARRRSAKADAQADFYFNYVKTDLPLKGSMERAAIEEAAMDSEMREQLLVCSICEGCSLYCTEEPMHMALFPAAAWFNHSCAPNARIESSRATLLVRASAPVSAGEEVFLSYLPPALLEESGERRRERLDGGRGFDCRCARCLAEHAMQETLPP